MGRERYAGTVTFLFTDIADARRRWDEAPTDMAEALRVHDDIVRSAMGGARLEPVVAAARSRT